jgi:inhibitor of KinA sporulation pathway (predicted exonuclease)
MSGSDRFLTVIDVEATCWSGPPPAGQVNEIIQIGMCIVDVHAHTRVERDEILVRPERSRVSAFCTELTGLTQEQVDTGVSFAEACALLVERHDAGSRRWASWGDYDRKQFERQCAAAGVPYPFAPRHVNAKARYAEAYNIRRPMGMARALAHAGLPLEGRHHNGADDAWNIAALVLTLVDAGVWPGSRPRVRDEREPRAVR